MIQDQHALKAELAKAEDQLAHVNDMVASQREVMAKWQQQNWELKSALDVLDSLERLQAMQIEYRDRMLKKVEAHRLRHLQESHPK